MAEEEPAGEQSEEQQQTPKEQYADRARQQAKQQVAQKAAQMGKQAVKKGAQAAANAARAAIAAVGASGLVGWIAMGIIVLGFVALLIVFIFISPAFSGKLGKTFGQPMSLVSSNDVSEMKQLLSNIGTDLTSKQDQYATDVAALQARINALEPKLGNVSNELKQQYQQIKDQVDQLAEMDPTTQKDAIKIILQNLGTKGIEFFNAFIARNVQGLQSYVDLNKSKGGILRIPTSSGMFNSGRAAGGNRPHAGLHNGYDFAGAVGTPVVAGWAGTIVSTITYDGWKIDGGDFYAWYGHINVNSELQVGSQVNPGDIIGWIEPLSSGSHLDIKVQRKSDGKWVDWAQNPWQVRAGDNNQEATVPWTR